MKKIEKKWIIEVWDAQRGKNEYLITFGTQLTPLLSDMRSKARACAWDVAQRSAQMVKEKTGKIARVILK